MTTYYRILDKNLIGRQDDMFDCFIFDASKGWVEDKDNVLMDRIVGYDQDGIGSSDMMGRIQEISEEEAFRLTS